MHITSVTCVVGLPGSGKTQLLWTKAPHGFFIDDPYNLDACLDWLRENSHGENTLWIADPYFCITQVRAQAEIKLFEKLGVRPNWIFFENDAEACMRNIARRMDGRKVRGLIHALKSRYEIPAHAHVLPVWQPETN